MVGFGLFMRVKHMRISMIAAAIAAAGVFSCPSFADDPERELLGGPQMRASPSRADFAYEAQPLPPVTSERLLTWGSQRQRSPWGEHVELSSAEMVALTGGVGAKADCPPVSRRARIVRRSHRRRF